MRAIEARVTGRVQGVFYRATTVEVAQRLGLAGWVRNETDGSVRLHAEGDDTAVDEFVAWCHDGPDAARVDEVQVSDVTPDGFSDFEVW
ncbi:acylphosphatase [Mariniluteicoccus endophyticus]